MPPEDKNARLPPTPQSIPLRNLSRPPDRAGTDPTARDRSDSLPSSRTRALLGSRRSFSGRVKTQGRYEGVLAGTSRDADSLVPHITTPRTPHFDDPGSPVNVGDFQSAVGGLGFTMSPTESPIGISPLRPILEDTSPYTAGINSVEGDDYFAATSDDRAPLTDARYLQPISGLNLPDAEGQRHDRNHSRHNSYARSTLGENLVESGRNLAARSLNRMSQLSIPAMPKSLSATNSPIGSAGSILRRMSQRVVNLSYEPDPVEPVPAIRKSVAPIEGPPSFPTRTAYAPDEYLPIPPPLEKAPPLARVGEPQYKWQQSTNPLRGRSLGIFGPDSRLRLWLCEILVHPITEPIILVLILIQTILLAVEAASSMPYMAQPQRWGTTYTDLVFLVLFAIYTLEISAKIIVSGFVKNALEYSTLRPGITVWQAVFQFGRGLFLSERKDVTRKAKVGFGDHQASIVRTFQDFNKHSEVRGHGRQAQRIRLARRAFLRHSFNRVDLLAVVSFWITFVLAITGIQYGRHIFVFQMLSCLRILRLLNLTNGTSIILRSLKKAAPLLVNVAFLVAFFWLLFAIVGVQSFKSSFRRTCVWFGPTINDVLSGNITANSTSNNYTQDLAPGNVQMCGGHIALVDGKPQTQPYLLSDLIHPGAPSAKGYICPLNSLCVEGMNPYNNTVSFDNILQSLEVVFVIMSANTFTDLLYYTTYSDSLAGALFFAFAIFILTFWLLNLLIAVITSSFQVIREESLASAFTTDNQVLTVEEEEEKPRRKKTPLKRLFDYTYWFWIILILISLISPSTASINSSQQQLWTIKTIEAVVTLMLLVEIILRFIADWRNFHRSPRNWVDLAIAIITSVIQLPPIRNSGQPYAWLTFFQIIRVYRLVLAVPLTRDLIMIVLGNVSGLLNLIVFVFLVCFLAAIFAVQLFRGAIPQYDADGNVIRITFANIYNSFIGMYQIFSSENWTAVMYETTTSDTIFNTSWIDAMFFIIWFAFANFIILNMFIAVIQENFDVSEDEKRLHQVRAFLQQKELTGSTPGNLSLANIFRLGREKTRQKDPIDYGPATIEMFKDTVVVEFLEEQMEEMDERDGDGIDGASSKKAQSGLLSSIWTRIVKVVWGTEPNPFYTSLAFSRPYDQLDPRTIAKEIATAAEERKRAQKQYLHNHPNYNKSLFIFEPTHPVREFCQKLVGPGRGSRRIEGIAPSKPYWYTFSAIIYISIVTMVVLACVTTPLYQREYFEELGRYTNRNWFVWTDLAFAGIFTIEAIVKIIADGFLFTPNAYYRGSWGFIDAVVLITLWISVSASLYNLGQISRGVGAVKALRALRLLNISDSARGIFHSVIIQEGWKLLSAAFVSLSLLIPFAIYGLNLFRGQFLTCNDINTGFTFLEDCVMEYGASPFSNNWNVWAPRQVANPYYSFDDFGSALFILFQIVSQEGWIDVMWSAMSATGFGNMPKYYASQGNAIFFISFNLLGSVFVLTLFISVFMRNYTEQTGVAFLTAEQRSWLELRKLLFQVSPSKRPSGTSLSAFKNWCYRIAVSKHGRWARFVTFTLVCHLVLLILEWYPEPEYWETIRNVIFLLFIVVFGTNIVIRFVGLGWKRFRRNSWDLYSFLAVSGSLITTILDLTSLDWNTTVIRQLHKYFLVAIALLLIPRNNQLDQLFKTAAASLSAIGNLLLTWLVLYLVFAIALTQTLGLTRFSSQETSNLNFRTVPKALILLFRMSCGEGWNQIMTDFANINPPFCNESDIFFDNDCGSGPWAKVLFIMWNLISMYIFVSLFVSLIFESFSYVYQRSSGLSAISREEIRRFKQAWATFDPDGTGFISKEAFPRLLGELSGVFEMRVYDGEHSVGQILEACRVDVRPGEDVPGVMYGVDIAALNKKLNTIDVVQVKRRRQQLNIFSQEVLVSADPDRGISFSSCLIILAHYKVITDSKALRLEEFLRRRYRLQRVEEEVRRRIVIGFFDTLFWSRQFRRRQGLRSSARMVDIPQFAVPEIFIDDEDGPADATTPRAEDFPGPRTPTSPRSPGLSLDISPRRPGSHDIAALSASPSSPHEARDRSFSFGTSPPRSLRSSPSIHPSRPSHDLPVPEFGLDGWHSRQSTEQQRGEGSSPRPNLRVNTTGFQAQGPGPASAARHRRQQSSQGSAQFSALDAFDNSAWGESIKRSFTVGRRGARPRRRLDNLPRMGE